MERLLIGIGVLEMETRFHMQTMIGMTLFFMNILIQKGHIK